MEEREQSKATEQMIGKGSERGREKGRERKEKDFAVASTLGSALVVAIVILRLAVGTSRSARLDRQHRSAPDDFAQRVSSGASPSSMRRLRGVHSDFGRGKIPEFAAWM